MKDTVKMLVESACVPDLDFATRNTAAFNILDPITESQKVNTTYIPQKVIVVKDPENQGGYLVEFSNNLERLMQDQDVGVIEAMQLVADVNDISIDECTLIIDESCVDKFDIAKLIELDTDFELRRK